MAKKNGGLGRGLDAIFLDNSLDNENKNEEIVRMSFPDMGNDSLWSSRALYTYAEAEGATVPSTMGYNSNTFNEGIEMSA